MDSKKLLPLLVVLLVTLPSLSSHADPAKRSYYITGASLLAIPTGVDTLLWGVAKQRDHALSWHLLPIVGPVVGLSELHKRPCTDARHGCPGDKALLVGTYLNLAAQSAGLVVIAIGLWKDSPSEASSVSMPLLISPRPGGALMSTGYAF